MKATNKPSHPQAALENLSVGNVHQAKTPTVLLWGLFLKLRKPLELPCVLSPTQSHAVAKELFDALFAPGQSSPVPSSGHMVVVGDTLLDTERDLSNLKVLTALRQTQLYIYRALPGFTVEKSDSRPALGLGLTRLFYNEDDIDGEEPILDMGDMEYDGATDLVCLPVYQVIYKLESEEPVNFDLLAKHRGATLLTPALQRALIPVLRDGSNRVLECSVTTLTKHTTPSLY